jgi:hypothetical protein
MRGKPFEPGNQKGRGRPPGSRNKKSLFFEEFQKNGLDAIRMVKLQALKGNQQALDSWLDRLEPRCKPANSRFRLPPIRNAEDLAKVLPALLQAVARGQISAQECETIGRTLESQQRVIQASEYEARIRALEQRTTERSGGTPGTGDSNGCGQQDSQPDPTQAAEGGGPLSSSSSSPPPSLEMEQPQNSVESGSTPGNDDGGESS